MTQRACVFISNVDDSEVRSECNGSQSFNCSRSVQRTHIEHGQSYILGRTYCWHCQYALSTAKESEIIFKLYKINWIFLPFQDGPER